MAFIRSIGREVRTRSLATAIDIRRVALRFEHALRLSAINSSATNQSPRALQPSLQTNTSAACSAAAKYSQNRQKCHTRVAKWRQLAPQRKSG